MWDLISFLNKDNCCILVSSKKRMVSGKKAQAFDTLALLGLILLVAVAVFYYASETSNTNAIYLSDTVKTVENTVESLSNLGDGSADTIVVRTPKGIETAELGRCDRVQGEDLRCKSIEIVFSNQETHLFEMNYPVWGSLGFFFIPGTHYVTMVNDGDNQQIVFQECGDGLVSGSEQCEACQVDEDCYGPGAECYIPGSGSGSIFGEPIGGDGGDSGGGEWGYCLYSGTGGCVDPNLCRPFNDPGGFGCYCECVDDEDCNSGSCNANNVCSGCEKNEDCKSGEYCSLGNCLDCDKDEDTFDGNWNSACLEPYDCDDAEPLVNPNALEGPTSPGVGPTCSDGIDNNCRDGIDCLDPLCAADPVLCPSGSCNDNGVCEVDETCSSCENDCGKCCPESLIDYWRVEEGTGATVTTSDGGIDASLITFPAGASEHFWDEYSYSVPMLDQWAVRFDETSGNTNDDALRFNDPAFNLEDYTSGTIEFVMDGIRGDLVPGREIFRTCNTVALCTNNNGMTIEFNIDGSIQARVRNGIDSVTVNDGGKCRDSNDPYKCYIVVTWEIGQSLKIYVNNGGPDVSSTSLVSGHQSVFAGPYIFALGSGEDSFVGDIHQFAFYNRSLSDAEVDDNFLTYYADLGGPFAGFLCGTGAQCGDSVVDWPEECDDGMQCSLGLNVCNGVEDCGPGETCGPMSGDGCDAACKLENPQVCGNGVIEPPEQCDDGINNGPPPAVCNTNCEYNPNCGDGIVTPPEECDGGWVCMYDAGSYIEELVDCTSDPLNCIGVGNETCAQWNGHIVSTCDENCNNKFDACDYITDYWRFEEEVGNVIYDVIGKDSNGYVPLDQRAIAPYSSEHIFFYDPEDYATMPLNILDGKGTLIFYMKLIPVSTFNTRILTHDNLIIDVKEIPANSDEMELVIKYGSPGNYQTYSTLAYGTGFQFPANFNFNFFAIKWDGSNIEVVYNRIMGDLIEHTLPAIANPPLVVDNALKFGYNGVGEESFVGSVDEFATFSERLNTYPISSPYDSLEDLYLSTVHMREADSYCGKKVCGDNIVSPVNSLGIVEECDDSLLFGSFGCSPPGTIERGDLADCQYATIGPYCGNGVVDPGETCDPPGGLGNPQVQNCLDCNNQPEPITVDGVCSADCSEWVYPDVCESAPSCDCGDGYLDPMTEECEPPGSIGDGYELICPTGQRFWVNGVCTNACNYEAPYLSCPGGSNIEPSECPDPWNPNYNGPADPRCSKPGDLCYTIDCPLYVKELRLSYGCPEGTSAHQWCWGNDINVKCDNGCQCPVVTPSSCECDIFCY